MKKIFISQPMNGKTESEILAERKIAEEIVRIFLGEEIEVIDSFIKDAPTDAKPLWYLGESLKLLSDADIAVFTKDWQNARGCRIEHICAKEYGIEIIERGTADNVVAEDEKLREKAEKLVMEYFNTDLFKFKKAVSKNICVIEKVMDEIEEILIQKNILTADEVKNLKQSAEKIVSSETEKFYKKMEEETKKLVLNRLKTGHWAN